ncbi:MAG: ArnT family glycosyltransferase [Isosphaeraceae bacterium]
MTSSGISHWRWRWRPPHAVRVGLLMGFVAALLTWQVRHTEIFFADGLRYIAQARRIDGGQGPSAIRKAVDHPVYPIAIVATRRGLGLTDDPEGWQAAAQIASAIAGVLLVVPLYQVARRLFGGSAAWLGVALVYLTPVPARVLGDALSEGTFLLFWTWGVWAALRHLREGSTRWLAVAVALSGLSYLVRPEGLLGPLALTAVLGLSQLFPATRLPARRWWRGVVFLGIGAAALVGPFVAFKGGIGTKPAVARLLGLAPASRPDAVERERPLDPNQSALQTVGLAARATLQSIRDAVTVPLLPFSALGIAVTSRRRGRTDARVWLFLAVIFSGSTLALMRLHATGGYCTPRHAMLVALPLFAAAGEGFRVVAAGLSRLARRRFSTSPRSVRFLLNGGVLLAVAAWNAPEILTPLNEGKGAYRDAGLWLRTQTKPDERVVDVTGWALFHGDRGGYTFADLHAAQGDPALRWIVVRDAHLTGPWGYCDHLRGLVREATLVARFPANRRRRASRVSIYRRDVPALTASAPDADRR